MDQAQITQLNRLIDEAELVSFDVFDTLLFRKTNSPEDVFDIMGEYFGIHGFKKLRIDAQNEAGRRTYAVNGYPHANYDEIYEVLSEEKAITTDIHQLKDFELQLEKDSLVVNKEMFSVFEYAKQQNKRIVITSDMYLWADTIEEILQMNGYTGFSKVYCSADEHKAKFNKELFRVVSEKEKVPCEKILHIGDHARDDIEYPKELGLKTFHYRKNADTDKLKNAPASNIDNGLYKILYDEKKGFWYNLGVEVGGPLYAGLLSWMIEKIKNTDRKIYFLSRDGYNLYSLLKQLGYSNIEYLYTSRRALLLAGITELTEEVIKDLPPFTKGQTVREILDYLCIPTESIQHLNEIGFSSFDDVIRDEDDVQSFKKLYLLEKDVFLEHCKKERENAACYFQKNGFLEKESYVFDCGWNGSSQHFLDRFKKALGCPFENPFYYFGIRTTEKSLRQLHGKHYETYGFGPYHNYGIQGIINEGIVISEFFFSSKEPSVYLYDSNGVVFEKGELQKEKEELLQGIKAFTDMALPFMEKYHIGTNAETATGHLGRLIFNPTEEEAVTIGDIDNVDGFANQDGETKKIAFITGEQLEANPDIEIYWNNGFLKRSDIPEELKTEIAQKRNLEYPQKENEYHLESRSSIISYNRWLKYQENHKERRRKLKYSPMFSIVMPVYNTASEQLIAAINSVLKQSYKNYELIMVDDHSTWENVRPILHRFEKNPKIRVIYRERNGHISEATNDAIKIATGDFLVFMDCDDVIAEDALYEFAGKINEEPELDFIYSDEDKITADGKIRHMPVFKPDWSPDFLMCCNYMNHLSVYRMSVVKKTGGLRSAYNGSQDYDFVLRFMRNSDNTRVGHISKVLYSWRERKESLASGMTAKNYASYATALSKTDYFRTNRIPAHVEYIQEVQQYRTVYEVTGEPLVSIVIPSKDNLEILKNCIDSIEKFTDYKHYEIIVVDNGSNENNQKETVQYLQDRNAIYLFEPMEFNFSKMCNLGAKHATGEYLLFLNDDIEAIDGKWLERMLGHAQQSNIGAVGAKLFYPDTNMIQHVGVVNMYDGPRHIYAGMLDQSPYDIAYNWMDHNCLAVTGACLLIKKERFLGVGSFDESFPVAYNDVDLCFSLYEAGYRNVARMDSVLYHYESYSRGSDVIDEAKKNRLIKEMNRLYQKHPLLEKRDPYRNDNLQKLMPVQSKRKKEAALEEKLEKQLERQAWEGDDVSALFYDEILEEKGMKRLFRKLQYGNLGLYLFLRKTKSLLSGKGFRIDGEI